MKYDKNSFGAQWHGGIFVLRNTHVKMAVLLHNFIKQHLIQSFGLQTVHDLTLLKCKMISCPRLQQEVQNKTSLKKVSLAIKRPST